MISAVVALLLAVPVLAGLIRSRKQRAIDRQHFAAFIGFSAAIVALISITSGITANIIWVTSPESPHDHPVEQGFVAIFSIIGLLSTSVAFVAGLCSSGIRRLALVLFAPAGAIIYLLAAFSNFGA